MSTELKVRKLLLRCFENGFSARNTALMIVEKFNVRGYASRTCQRWFRKFKMGDFNLMEKPTHDSRPRKRLEKNPLQVGKRSRANLPQKQVKVEEVTFQRENKPQDIRTRAGSDVVQRFMQRNRQITVSKVKSPTISVKEPAKLMPKRTSQPVSSESRPKEGTIRVKESSKLMSKQISPPLSKETPMRPSSYSQRRSALPGLQQRTSLPMSKDSVTRPSSYSQRRSALAVLQQQRPQTSNRLTPKSETRDLKTDLRLPPSIAKKMATTHLSTESHTLGEGGKSVQKSGETSKKSITVQFQNVSPEVVKNTVRKSTDSAASGNKKSSTQSANSLASPKGVIYLNPQEIFGDKLVSKNPPKKTSAVPLPKAPSKVAPKRTAAKPSKPPAEAAAPAPPPPTVTIDDSDDDLMFPDDASFPAPKVKAVVNTFTTYWDMETDKPILINPTNDVISTLPVIEIE